jgi:6-pyruvoyltetrahydropterin/6-carboxytetrahydropterin synthase
MYELTVERHFAAAHKLVDYAGACARLHGHNYRVLVSFCGEKLDAEGFLVDFATLKAVCEGVLAGLDHQYLNDLPAFAGKNPTAETLAEILFGEMAAAAEGLPARVSAVTVYESESAAVTYREA